MFTHKCVKCEKEYQDSDPDPYYCDLCNKTRLEIAKRIDKEKKGVVAKKSDSLMSIYDKAPKGPGGFPKANNFL